MEQKIALRTSAWTSFFLMFLGIWLFVASLTFGYENSILGKNDVVCGLILLICGWKSRIGCCYWAPWLACLVGLWLQVAPLFFWATDASTYLVETFTGILTILFSIIVPGIPGHKERTGVEIPPGWSYNPSSWPQRMPVIALACFGWFAARYLAVYQLGYIDAMWDPYFAGMHGENGTVCVITSALSKSFPVSDAGMGAFAYSLEALLGCKGGTARWRTMPWLVVGFGILVVPLGLISILLIISQPLIVGCWCLLCLMIGFAMLIMVMLTIDEVRAALQAIKWARKAGLSWFAALWEGPPEAAPVPDDRTPPLSSSINAIFAAGFWGCNFRWNLIATTILGVLTMTLPAYLPMPKLLANFDHVLGALTIVVSVVSMAEPTRNWRYALAVFGLILVIWGFVHIHELKLFFPHLILGGGWIVLCFPKGELKERYG